MRCGKTSPKVWLILGAVLLGVIATSAWASEEDEELQAEDPAYGYIETAPSTASELDAWAQDHGFADWAGMLDSQSNLDLAPFAATDFP